MSISLNDGRGRPTTEDDMGDEVERERIECLVQQGFTQSLAQKVLLARSKEYLPLTIWIVDNSSSMNATDGRRLVSTESQDDIRIMPCTRWEELKETVMYHVQLAALLDAPTKFIMLNPSDDDNNNNNNNGNADNTYSQEMSIAERGSEWIEDDMDFFMDNFSRVRPRGATPLTDHLRRISQSLGHLQQMKTKIVLVLATDGKPTDRFGFVSPSVDREFETALRQIQSKAWIVIRLCTNDDTILKYYQRLDEHMELSLEVLDDYMDEATEVHGHNPWLTYSLGLHRCREMGMSCHATFRFLDWLDERPLTRDEISEVLRGTFGLIDGECNGSIQSSSSHHHLEEDWDKFCEMVHQKQENLTLQRNKNENTELKAFFPWNPIKKRTTHWVDIRNLKRHGSKKLFSFDDNNIPVLIIFAVVIVAVLLSYRNSFLD